MIAVQSVPNIQELKTFINDAFEVIDPNDSKKFTEAGNGQSSIDDWFSVEAIPSYLNKGKLLEARNDKGELVGAGFIGMQNPISWPDGKKAKLFLIAVSPEYRNQGVGKLLLVEAENMAKLMGSKKLIINVHVFQEQTHKWYQRQGYKEMGVLNNYYDNGSAKFFYKDLQDQAL